MRSLAILWLWGWAVNNLSLEELKAICERLETRIANCYDGNERERLEALLKETRGLLVAKQQSLLCKLESVVHDPRLEGSAPPLVKHSKLGEFCLRVLQRLRNW